MKRAGTILVVLLLNFTQYVIYGQVDTLKVKDAAEQFIISKISGSNLTPVTRKGQVSNLLVNAYTSSDTCRNRLFGYDVATGGYVIAFEHGDDVIITAYSLTGSIGKAMNPQMMAFLRAYESTEILRVQSAVVGAGTKGTLNPLLDMHGIAWDQGTYYNSSCPYDAEAGARTPVGCVAVALGQILRFHKYPATGAGSYSYTHQKYGTLSAAFGSTTYDWNSMPGSLTAENSEVAKILFHIGVALNMNYSPSASGASIAPIPRILSDHFRYHDAQYISRDNFSWFTNEMEEIFRQELDNGRPFFYELLGDPPHAVAVDGYDGDYFHINFGWGGSGNGYFLLSGSDFAGGYQFGFRGNSILGISPSRIPVAAQDSLALVSLFNATGGQSWHDRTNWLAGRLKNWKGVDIVNGRVIHLILTDNNLTGSIPSDIGKLTGLKGINISSNKIAGSLPKEIGMLSDLYDLTISFNEFSGPIPPEIGNLTNLRTLQAGFNKFTGQIPSSIGQLGSLSMLSLAGNQLTGNIPDQVCNLAQLTSLVVSQNQLTGSLPQNIGNLSRLSSLSVAKNKLSGTLPSSLGALSNLTVFSIEDNEFTGSLPSGIGNFTQLSFLNLDNNRFTSLPEEIGQLVNLTRFTAVNNSISGALPASIGLLARLTHLDLSSNKITSLPDEIGNLIKLEYLSLAGNLIGQLPPSIGKLKTLAELRLTSNMISSIPYEIGNMTSLTQLAADYNMIKELTFGASLLRKLAILDLSYNCLSGPLPPLSHIRFHSLDLDHNKLKYNDLLSSGLVNPEPGCCYYRYQDLVRLPEKKIYFSVNDSVVVDLRTIPGLSHGSNIYSWYKDGSAKSEGPVLKIAGVTSSDAGKYYCLIDNPLYPSLTLSTDTLELVLRAGDVSQADVVESKNGSVLSVADNKVRIIKPSGLRGEFTWQASQDSHVWVNLPANSSYPDIAGNIRSVNIDSLVVVPLKPAMYRYRLKEENCDPVFSDTVKISPFKSAMLLDTVINVSASFSDIDLGEIQINIPKGLSNAPFRLTVQKIETPPAAPDTVVLGSVYDVAMSCGTKFDTPVTIKIKLNDEFTVLRKGRYVPVYHDDINYEWVSYDNYNISTDDTTIVFETDHLTKLSYWEKSWTDGDYTDKFVNGQVTVYYKAKHADLMGLYAKNQESRAWHVAPGNSEYGTPLQVQDMAHFTSEVMTKFRQLGLRVPDAIAIYADDIDDYGVVGLMGMTNGYLTLSIYIDDPDLLRSVVAHEYMHYTQDYYMLAQPGNIFWMEANGHTADRMVWDDSILPVSESDKYLLDNRIGENNIFKFLSRSWDYWDASILTQNLAGNVDYCYQAGTFIHYMRSYKDGVKLKPEVLLKETSSTGTWREYLDSYIQNKLGSTIGRQYEDFVKFIVKGTKPSFSLLNNTAEAGVDPFRFFNQAPAEFAEKHLVKLPEDEMTVPVQEESITKELEPLSAKMEQFYNLSMNRSLCIKYVRQHTDTAGLHVYLCKYNPVTKNLDLTDISKIDSSYFFVLAAAEPNISEKSNQVFLLYINNSGDRNITAEYDLEITPVTDFSSLFTFWFSNTDGTEAYIHQHNNGVKRRIYFWEQDGVIRNKVYTDSSFTITETRSNGILEVYYNFRNGNMIVTENVSGTYEYNDDPDIHTASYSGTSSISLKNIFFAPQEEQYVLQGAGIYDFHSTGTSHTQSLIVNITNTYHSQCTDCGSAVVLESYDYTGTDWSGGSGIKLNIQVK